MSKFAIQFTMNKEFPSAVGQIEQEGRQTESFNFEGFARIPEYRQVNRDLLRNALILLLKQPLISSENPIIQLDVAAGTGLVAQETIKALDDVAPQTTLKSIGVEPDPFAIQKAKENTPCTPLRFVEFIQGFGQELKKFLAGKIPSGSVDFATIHDALHEIRREEDKKLTLSQMAKMLKPGGIFTFNSAFTTVGMGNDGMKWGRWKSKAMQLLGSTRDKGIPAMKIHTPQEYANMIIETGLTVLYQGQKTINLTREALEKISIYPNFIRGVFEDMVNTNNFSLEQKSQALIDALDQLKVVSLLRVWHEIIAQKPAPLKI